MEGVLSLSVANLMPSVRVCTNVYEISHQRGTNTHPLLISGGGGGSRISGNNDATGSGADGKTSSSGMAARLDGSGTSCSPAPPCTPEELTKAFQKVQEMAQPLVGSKRQSDEAFQRINCFHASQLNTFLYGYMYPNERIPEQTLDNIRSLCGNGDPEWAYRCQLLALEVLSNAVYARSHHIVPRSRQDDPAALATLRGILPVMDPIPKVSMKMCHFVFVGYSSSNKEAALVRMASEKLVVKNKGWKPFCVVLSQSQTVIDDQKVEDAACAFGSLDGTGGGASEVKGGERLELFMTGLRNVLPESGFSYFQQLLVLTVDGVFRIFCTVTVISLQSTRLQVAFPACLPVPVVDSPLGKYSTPVMLQVLKHLFVLQRGYSSPSVSHLLLGKSVNFRVHNEAVMQTAAQLRRTVMDMVPLADLLDQFWTSVKATKKGVSVVTHVPPSSLCCPSGFTPAKDFPLKTEDPNDPQFPNGNTEFSPLLRNAPPAVLFGLILEWLAEMPISIFDESCINCEPVGYLEATPPHHRGVLLFVIDLCCALLANKVLNGTTKRTLALTFASVLCRRSAPRSDEDGSGSKAPSSVISTTFEIEMGIQHSAVSAILQWLHLFEFRYQNL